MIKGLIVAIYLSQTLIGVAHAHYSHYTELRNNNPFSGARGIDVVLVPEEYTTPKTPVPYYEFWDCPWKQTAQQCVAIESMLQQELNELYRSPMARELRRLKERIEENNRSRQVPNQ